MTSFCHFSCWLFKSIASSSREAIQVSQARVFVDSGTQNRATVSLCPAVSFCPALHYEFWSETYSEPRQTFCEISLVHQKWLTLLPTPINGSNSKINNKQCACSRFYKGLTKLQQKLRLKYMGNLKLPPPLEISITWTKSFLNQYQSMSVAKFPVDIC